MLIGLPAAPGQQLGLPAFTGAGFNLQNVQLQAAHCDFEEAWLTQLKLTGIYTVPRIDVGISATYQNMPGPNLAATFVASNAAI